MGSDTELVARLKAVPLLQDLSRAELKRVVAAGKERTHPSEHSIVRQGELGVGLHIILEGQADVIINGRRRSKLGPGDHFGEIAVIDGGVRMATVTAVSEMRTFSITSWAFLSLVTKNPSLARKVMLALCAMLRQRGGLDAAT